MARKRLILITTICLAIALMLPQFAMAAASSPSFSVEASKSALKKGEEVTVTVRGTGLQDVYAYELHLYFNSSLLAFKQGSETSTVVGFGAPATVSETGGTHVVFAHTKTGSGAGNSGSVDLATFTFTAVNEGDAELNLKEIQLIDSNLSTSSVANNFTTSVEVGSGSISNPNPDSGGVTGPTGPSGPTGPTTPAVDPVTVTADQLKDDGEGKATVELTGPATALKLPADTADLLGRTLLNVVAGKA
ncbi:cohesin domain-containing protein, partial [Paenibacillus sepulcri]|nr:cohesin domain-containing protein [Paenibacillus sepulcri]